MDGIAADRRGAAPALAHRLAAAKEKLYGLRQTREAYVEANAVQRKHGSRKSGLPPKAPTKRRAHAAPDGQGQLFQSSIFDSTMAR